MLGMVARRRDTELEALPELERAFGQKNCIPYDCDEQF